LPKDGKFDVKVKLADGTIYARAGKVNFTDVRVNPQTGTIEARALMPNPQGLLRPGQFARVQLSGGVRTGALAVPQRAVLEGPTSKIVLTVNQQGMVEPRPVEVGDWSGDEWIITGGLKPGDRVIVDGMVKARPGAPVKITDAAAAAPATPPQPGASKPAAAQPQSSAAKPAAAQTQPAK
jgi:membrane fusion protein (multidrug efflux system)